MAKTQTKSQKTQTMVGIPVELIHNPELSAATKALYAILASGEPYNSIIFSNMLATDEDVVEVCVLELLREGWLSLQPEYK